MVESFVEVGELHRHVLARCFDAGIMRSGVGHMGTDRAGNDEESLEASLRQGFAFGKARLARIGGGFRAVQEKEVSYVICDSDELFI